MKRIPICCLSLCLMMGALLPCTALAQADGFSPPFLAEDAEPIITDTSYRSADIVIEIQPQRLDNSDVYVADIYVRDIQSLRRAFSGGEWKTSTQSIRTLAEESGAILAMTGDSSDKFSSGWVIGNGIVYRDTRNSKRQLCILYQNGEMKTFAAAEIDNEQIAVGADDIWHTFLFGPALLDASGKAIETFTDKIKINNPRSAIGYYEPGHYCFVQVDGRNTASALEHGKKNRGMTLAQLSALMESLGCQAAYNLDGGQSAAMWFCGEVISTPYNGGRYLADIVLIKE